MERREIEGMLNLLGVKKDRLSEAGMPLDELYPIIGILVIAQQLMLLVEQGARPKVDCRKLAEDIIDEVEEQSAIESWKETDQEAYKQLVDSVESLIKKRFNER